MSSFQKAATSFLSIVAIGIFAAIIWVYQIKWQTPLGPPLQIATIAPFKMPPTWTPNPDATEAALSTLQPASATQTSPPPPTPTQEFGFCDAPSVMTILAVGSDSRSEGYTYGLADVIRLIRIDSVIPKVTVLEFPRDLWVEIPDIADNLNGQDHEKLNQAYLYGNAGFRYTNDPAQGPGLLARTLALNFGTQITNYGAINMQTFVKIVDAVGGLDVTLPKPVDGRTADDQNERLAFPKGEQHLNGIQALTLARIRIGGVFKRADTQNIVLCALRQKLNSPEIISDLPKLIKSFHGAIQTDLSPKQLSQLACIGTKLEPENIIFTSFPEDLFTQDRMYDLIFKKDLFVWNADYERLREYVHQFNIGDWPQAVVMKPNNDEGETLNCK